MAAHFELIGGELVAGDSTKLRAQNSKKNNFNPGKIERHIAYIDAKLEEYNKALAQEDGDTQEKNKIQTKIKKHQLQKEKYQQYKEIIATTGVTQISTSDPDSRQLMTTLFIRFRLLRCVVGNFWILVHNRDSFFGTSNKRTTAISL